MPSRALIRLGVPGVVLAAAFYAGFRSIGPMPPLGALLDPATGVWAVAAQDEFPGAGITVPGTRDSVRIVFDDRAVPHVFATNAEDAYRALGYLHAWFRLFQLELQTRGTNGTLSEWFGERALAFDRDRRHLGLAWSAERGFARLDSTSRIGRIVLAYAEGINARIDELGPRDLPLEYRLLGATPQRWEPLHTFYLIKSMGYTLAYGHPDRRFQRLEAAIGSEAAAALLPLNSPIQEPIVPSGANGPRFDPRPIPPPLPGPGAAGAAGAAEGAERVAEASNNWVVAPERTANGYALLAGDPHLDLSLPSVWFEVHLVVPGAFDVYGVGFPGGPAVAIGFNRDVAWSFTNTGADVLDYYAEQVDDPDDPERYRLDGQWRSLERRVEVYRGRRGNVLATDTVFFTHRGPLRRDEDGVRSIRWTVLEDDGASEALLDLAYTRSVAEWLAVMESFRSPIQNGIAADRAGEIAALSAGAYPLRPGGASGLRVWDGSTGASDWQGYLPRARFPVARNPRQGFLASANQQPIDPATDPAYLGAWWPAPWRAMHINRLLRADSTVTVDDMRRFQTDPGSARADLFVPAFLDAVQAVTTADDDGRREATTAARLLREWDRRYTRENERAILFELAMDALARATWDELRDPEDSTGRRRVFTPGSPVLAQLLRDPTSTWWDDHDTEPVETRDDILVRSLVAGYERALDRFGPVSEGGWRWDRLQQANIYHLLRFRSMSALELPVQGGPATLNPSSGSGRHGPSWRMVVELGPEVRAWGVYPGGQSGNPASRWYTDRLAKWMGGALDPLPLPRSPDDLPADQVLATAMMRGVER